MPALSHRAEIGSPTRAVFKKPRPGEMPYYELPDDQLSHGASLANARIWVTTKATGAVSQVFSNEAGTNLLGSIVVTYAVPSKVLITSSPEPHCLDASGISYVLAEPEGVGTMQIFPFLQRHAFDLTGELSVAETILVPKLVEEDPPVVLQHIEITNDTEEQVSLLLTIYTQLQGGLGDDLVVEFDRTLGALAVYNQSRPEAARVSAPKAAVSPTAPPTTFPKGMPVPRPGDWIEIPFNRAHPWANCSSICRSIRLGQRKGRLSPWRRAMGVEDAKRWYRQAGDFHEMRKRSHEFLTPAVSVSMVETPDAVINEGVFWSKVNMVKVTADYPEGKAFTNEPGISSNVVGRDMAWFVYGSDYLYPYFSRRMLCKFAEKQYPSVRSPVLQRAQRHSGGLRYQPQRRYPSVCFSLLSSLRGYRR